MVPYLFFLHSPKSKRDRNLGWTIFYLLIIVVTIVESVRGQGWRCWHLVLRQDAGGSWFLHVWVCEIIPSLVVNQSWSSIITGPCWETWVKWDECVCCVWPMKWLRWDIALIKDNSLPGSGDSSNAMWSESACWNDLTFNNISFMRFTYLDKSLVLTRYHAGGSGVAC